MIEEERLQGNCSDVGTYLLHRLSTLMFDHTNIVGDVRGKGLMIGVELVSDPETRTPLPNDDMLEIFEDTKNMGLLIGKGGVYNNVRAAFIFTNHINLQNKYFRSLFVFN